MPHSEETRAKMRAGQNRPDVLEKKRKAARKYWRDVRAGRKPPPRRGGGGPKPKTVEERFWPKVKVSGPDDCWEWQANLIKGGYGRISRGPKGEYLAHRVSWILRNGDIPDGLLVLHSCDNPKCVNPKHLFLGTHQDNFDDMVSKGRWPGQPNWASYLKGENRPNAKLSDSKVKKIYRLRSKGWSQQRIADHLGVSQSCVSHVLNGRSWTHVSV